MLFVIALQDIPDNTEIAPGLWMRIWRTLATTSIA
jgi:hypothetical protein